MIEMVRKETNLQPIIELCILHLLRYTLFIVLYPIGVTGELLCCYNALDYVKKMKIFTLAMPNKINFAFDYHLVLIGICLMYIPRKFYNQCNHLIWFGNYYLNLTCI